MAEAGVVALAQAGARPLAVVPRGRRRGRWQPLTADAVVAVLAEAGPDAVVLARTPAGDPGAGCLPALARLMGQPWVRLPDEAARAGWALAVACHAQFGDEDLMRRLEVLVGAAAGSSVLPRRAAGAGDGVPALRPGVLARWAGRVWRPCARCGGGGLAGAACARCGAPGPEAAA